MGEWWLPAALVCGLWRPAGGWVWWGGGGGAGGPSFFFFCCAVGLWPLSLLSSCVPACPTPPSHTYPHGRGPHPLRDARCPVPAELYFVLTPCHPICGSMTGDGEAVEGCPSVVRCARVPRREARRRVALYRSEKGKDRACQMEGPELTDVPYSAGALELSRAVWYGTWAACTHEYTRVCEQSRSHHEALEEEKTRGRRWTEKLACGTQWVTTGGGQVAPGARPPRPPYWRPSTRLPPPPARQCPGRPSRRRTRAGRHPPPQAEEAATRRRRHPTGPWPPPRARSCPSAAAGTARAWRGCRRA